MKLPQIKISKKTAILVKIGLVSLTAVLILLGLYTAVLWGNHNKFVFRSLVAQSLVFQSPLKVEKIKEVSDVTILRTPDDIFLATQYKKQGVYEMAKSTKHPEIAMYILATFGEDGEEMLATFIAESGLNPDAKNWNCTYPKDGQMVSTFCKEEDRGKAWSVDCGVAQLNFSGTECPKEAFDPVWNVDMAKKKFNRQGKGAWVANTTKAHEKYMVNKPVK